VRVDRLVRAIPARRQAIGDRKQCDVDLHGSGRMQIAIDGAAPERLRLVDEKPRAEMVAYECGDMRAQALAGTQALQNLARERGPPHVVTDEGDPPVPWTDGARERLGGIMQKRTPAKRLAAGQLIGKRLLEQPTNLRTMALERAYMKGAAGLFPGQCDRLSEDLDRVVVDIEMVVAILLHTPERIELGEHDSRCAQLTEQLEPA
jgi:hypothetical protein